jgi:hypothetical protein
MDRNSVAIHKWEYLSTPKGFLSMHSTVSEEYQYKQGCTALELPRFIAVNCERQLLFS